MAASKGAQCRQTLNMPATPTASGWTASNSKARSRSAMSSPSRIGLGTAQFGMDYGISNRSGRPSELEVAAIVARAAEAGIGYLDTASGYGEAETLIGRHLPSGHSLRIVTKLPPIAGDTIEARHKS